MRVCASGQSEAESALMSSTRIVQFAFAWQYYIHLEADYSLLDRLLALTNTAVCLCTGDFQLVRN